MRTITSKKVLEFGKRFAEMLQKEPYPTFCKQFSPEWRFDMGGCFMTHLVLRRVFNGYCSAYAVACHDAEANDWPLQHFVVKIRCKPFHLYLDSNGAMTEDYLKFKMLVTSVKRGTIRKGPVRPLKSKIWTGNGLWTGDHYMDNYDEKIRKYMQADAFKLAHELKTVPNKA